MVRRGRVDRRASARTFQWMLMRISTLRPDDQLRDELIENGVPSSAWTIEGIAIYSADQPYQPHHSFGVVVPPCAQIEMFGKKRGLQMHRFKIDDPDERSLYVIDQEMLYKIEALRFPLSQAHLVLKFMRTQWQDCHGQRIRNQTTWWRDSHTWHCCLDRKK